MIAPERTGGKPLFRAESAVAMARKQARKGARRSEQRLAAAAFWTVGITRSLSES
jgi:hypothetical protein